MKARSELLRLLISSEQFGGGSCWPAAIAAVLFGVPDLAGSAYTTKEVA
jgi:hypothetical protein